MNSRPTFYVTTPIYYPDAETSPLGYEMEGVSVGPAQIPDLCWIGPIQNIYFVWEIPPRSAGLHVNDNPHIGRGYETIPKDYSIVRRRRNEVF